MANQRYPGINNRITKEELYQIFDRMYADGINPTAKKAYPVANDHGYTCPDHWCRVMVRCWRTDRGVVTRLHEAGQQRLNPPEQPKEPNPPLTPTQQAVREYKSAWHRLGVR